MTRTDLLRSMIRALSDIREEGDTYEVSDQWEVTVHAGRKSAQLTVPHVIRIALKPDFVVLETNKGHRFAIVDEEVHAVAQEPSERESKNRRAGFA